jgi:hypothetical protein
MAQSPQKSSQDKEGDPSGSAGREEVNFMGLRLLPFFSCRGADARNSLMQGQSMDSVAPALSVERTFRASLT